MAAPGAAQQWNGNGSSRSPTLAGDSSSSAPSPHGKSHQAPPPSTDLSLKSIWAPPSWSGKGCEHLEKWLESPSWKDDYGAVLKFVNTARLQRLAGKAVMQKEMTVCFKCNEGPLLRLYVSLASPFVGCKEGGCMVAHLQQTNHTLAMDMQRGEIYCFACNDMVYDVRIEEERASLLQHIALGSDEAATATAAKRARVHGDSVGCKKITKHCVPRRLEWVPTHLQIQTLKEQAAPPEPEGGIAGLRGLYNLGNTCFLNCVLQGLVHNPGIRDYFLGDYHNRHRCRLRREQAGQQDFVCMGCEMDRLVDECFQGSKAAYTPHSFLFGMWKSSQHLAGYEQQDAHECFISLLDALQESCKHDLESENVHENVDLMQHLFRGFMRSDVRCLECGARSQVCAHILFYLARDTLTHSRVRS